MLDKNSLLKYINNIIGQDFCDAKELKNLLNPKYKLHLIISGNPYWFANISNSPFFDSCQNVYNGEMNKSLCGSIMDMNSKVALIVLKKPYTDVMKIRHPHTTVTRSILRYIEDDNTIFADMIYPLAKKDNKYFLDLIQSTQSLSVITDKKDLVYKTALPLKARRFKNPYMDQLPLSVSYKKQRELAQQLNNDLKITSSGHYLYQEKNTTNIKNYWQNFVKILKNRIDKKKIDKILDNITEQYDIFQLFQRVFYNMDKETLTRNIRYLSYYLRKEYLKSNPGILFYYVEQYNKKFKTELNIASYLDIVVKNGDWDNEHFLQPWLTEHLDFLIWSLSSSSKKSNYLSTINYRLLEHIKNRLLVYALEPDCFVEIIRNLISKNRHIDYKPKELFQNINFDNNKSIFEIYFNNEEQIYLLLDVFLDLNSLTPNENISELIPTVINKMLVELYDIKIDVDIISVESFMESCYDIDSLLKNKNNNNWLKNIII